MNEIRGAVKRVRFVSIVTSFLMVVSGLGLFPIVGEENSEIQIEKEIVENRHETKIPVMVPTDECDYDMGYTVENSAPIESEKNQTNIPPVADAGPDYIFKVGPFLPFFITAVNGSGSYDPDGTIVDYHWNFGDGTIGSGVYAMHSFAGPGNYTVTLTVTDDDGAIDTDTAIWSIVVMPGGTVTTDKYTYRIGEPVAIFTWGIMSLPALGDHWYIIEDKYGNLVVDNSGLTRATAVQLVSDPYVEVWNQTFFMVPQHGQQVPTGKYYVWHGWGRKLYGPAEFEIINSSGNSIEPLKVTTDKYTYYQGEPVHITITGNRVGPSSDFNRGYLIMDEFGHWVRDPPQLHTTDVHYRSGPDNYTWYQKYEILNEYDISGNHRIHYPNNGEQVSTGKYYIYPYPGNCEPAEIEIIERPELIIEKEKISGPDEILTHTYHEWELKITVSGASPTKSYENVVVYDVLPAELELLEFELSQGTLTVTKKGKGKMGSTHLTWHVGDLYDEAELILKIATRKNPAGKQEFTSLGKYLLNEGASAKGTDSSTGKNLRAGPTEPIYITVLENQNHNNKKPHH
jgi:chitodextrinase